MHLPPPVLLKDFKIKNIQTFKQGYQKNHSNIRKCVVLLVEVISALRIQKRGSNSSSSTLLQYNRKIDWEVRWSRQVHTAG